MRTKLRSDGNRAVELGSRRWCRLSVFATLAVGILTSSLGTLAATVTATRTSAFEYDAQGLISKEIIEPDNPSLCVVTTYSRDAVGNVVSSTTRNCNGSSSEAAAPTGDAVFTARTASVTFDARGQFPVTSTNALGQSETKAYDARFGTITSLTGPNGLTTTWSYDGFGRKTLETRADGTTTTWTYALCSGVAGGTASCPTYGVMVVTVTSTGSPTGKTYADSLGRTIRAETQGFDGTVVRSDTVYDSLGRVAKASQPYYENATPVWTNYSYDSLGRVLTETAPATAAGTRITSIAYNGLTVATSVNSSPVQTKTVTKNSQGQTALVTDTQGKGVGYAYDPFGNLVQTNAGGVLTTVTYDLRGRKTAMADPDMGAWSYAYNALGELIRQTDAKAQTTTLSYDKLGRLVKRTEPNLVSNWYFDSYKDGTACAKGIGKLCQAESDNGYVRKVGYDSLGRPSSLTTTIDTTYTVTTTYITNLPNAGKVDTIRYPTGFAVKYIYAESSLGSLGYLMEVRKADDNSLLWRANSRNAAGQILSETLGNGLSTTTTYDAVNRPTQIVSGATGNTVQDMSFGYDLVGNLVSRIDAAQTVSETFTYDSLNRLTQATGLNLATSKNLDARSFGYDALGNITSKSDVGSYVYPAIGSPRPHAVASVTGIRAASYSYDANGNLTAVAYANGNSRTLTYGSFGLPTQVKGTVGGQAFTYDYSYNAEHERVKLVTTRTDGVFTSIYLHPAGKGQLLYEKEIQPTKVEHKHYVQAGGELIGVFVTKSVYAAGDGPQMRFYHRDHPGSVVAITNPSGAVLERLAYEAFGQRRFPNGTADPNNTLFGITTDRGYTGHEHLDELALIHMNGRIYDPVLARFMTPDPFIQAPDNLQSYNRYSYVMNNPFGYVDPTGYGWLSKLFKKLWRPAVAIAVVAFAPEISAAIGWTGGISAGAAVTGGASGALGLSGAVASGALGGASRFQFRFDPERRRWEGGAGSRRLKEAAV